MQYINNAKYKVFFSRNPDILPVNLEKITFLNLNSRYTRVVIGISKFSNINAQQIGRPE